MEAGHRRDCKHLDVLHDAVHAAVAIEPVEVAGPWSQELRERAQTMRAMSKADLRDQHPLFRAPMVCDYAGYGGEQRVGEGGKIESNLLPL